MAAEDRTTSGLLSREQRAAALLVDRLGLTPPIDVASLARRFADVEFDAIPGSCDGLVVGLHGPRPRPLILVDDEPHEFRQRFTLAHELGHVLLPWHVGSNFACDTTRRFLDPEYRGMFAEPEANRFAGELLVPSGWLREQLRQLSGTQMAPVLAITTGAQVSAHVACLRLSALLPPGYVFAMVDQSGRVVLSGQSTGTRLRPPEPGDPLDPAALDRFALETEVINYRGRRIVWWRFAGEIPPDDTEDDGRTARGVLAELLDKHVQNLDEQRAIQRTLAGVIGAANGEARREGDTANQSLYLRFRSRFAKKRDLPDVFVADPDFDVWIRKRADELAST